jgi:uncharacterized protein (DUF697 family)
MGCLDILGLSALVATAKQQDQSLTFLRVVHPVTGAVIDPQFADAATHALLVTEQACLEPIQSSHDAVAGRAIP